MSKKHRFYVCKMFSLMDNHEVSLANAQPVIGWDKDGCPETPAGTVISDTPRNRSYAIYDRTDDRILVNGYPEYVGYDELRDAFVELLNNHSDRVIRIKW